MQLLKNNIMEKLSVSNTPAQVHIQRWLRHPRNKPKSPPLVMKSERYFKSGLRHKFHIGNPILNAFLQLGILHHSENRKISYREFMPFDTSSIAKITQIGWKTNGLEALIEREPWNEETAKKYTPIEQVERLCNAYTGSFWFEMFRNRYIKMHQKLGRPLPHIHEWQIIQRNSLDYLLFADISNKVMRLCERKIILPRNGCTFKEKSCRNLVHPGAIAQLLAFLHETQIDEIYIPADKDNFLKKMLDNLVENNIMPYMLKNEIHPAFWYDPFQASKKSHLSTGVLKHARLQGRLPYKESDNPEKPLVRGIDLALFALRKPSKKSYNINEIAARFGVKPEHVKELHLPPTPYERTYGAQASVEPLYDEVAGRIRTSFIQDKNAPAQESRFGEYVSKATIYYGCRNFTEVGLALFPAASMSI